MQAEALNLAPRSTKQKNLPKLPAILAHLSECNRALAERAVCLTFDDGPDPAYTGRLLDLLRDFKVRASFFVLGEAANEYPYLIERMIDAGHCVGNHTQRHYHPWMVWPSTARQEVAEASLAIAAITGFAPRFFRPPHGRIRRAMLQQVQQEQMKTVLWSQSAIDWGPLGTNEGIAERFAKVEAGDIVLMHDGQRIHNHPAVTLTQLPHLLSRLAAQNIACLSLDEVFAAQPIAVIS